MRQPAISERCSHFDLHRRIAESDLSAILQSNYSAIQLSGRRERLAFRHQHEHERARPAISRRTRRRVNGANRLEERPTHGKQLLRLVVDGESHLTLEDIPEDRSWM